jgi:hypothetical protein
MSKTELVILEEKSKVRRPHRGFHIPKTIRSPLPESLETTLVYCDDFSLDPAAGVLSKYAFSANGLYDPNLTGTGHQPKGFDQLMAIYDHVVCYRSTIRVDHSSAATAGPVGVIGVNLLDTVDTTFSDYHDLVELGAKYLVLPFNASISNTPPLYAECDVRKFLGVDDVFDDRSLSTAITSNPTEDVVYSIWYQASDLSSNPEAVQFVVKIKYHVRFVEPKQLIGS